jgi:adenine phosphoribosyltransferase
VERLASLIRPVADFPKPGIVFRDVTPLLRDPYGLTTVTGALAERYRDRGVDLVAAVESRGFLFAAPLAVALGAGVVPIRKLGKLPARTITREYSLEYGSNHLEVHLDAVEPGQRVLLLDDVLATGGTAAASLELLEELGGVVVESAFVVEISGLGGRDRLAPRPVHALLTF